MGRSSAYWTSNLYTDAAVEPPPTAPLHDLPANAAARFQSLRTGLLQIEGVSEQVRFMGPKWQWAWEYGIGNRKLCWLHFMRTGVDVTFTLSENEEGRLAKGPKIAGGLARAILEGQRTGPVKWCWLELVDRRAADAFLSLARRKAEWLGERPALRRAPRAQGSPGGEEVETD
ncbi:MAG TPA: hypothetical protein VFY42_00885 [Gemmatimonadales bacterium]|jgi:hypothetical protein|nr:hypothetical protein [Gemmatimonadales bacterium]